MYASVCLARELQRSHGYTLGGKHLATRFRTHGIHTNVIQHDGTTISSVCHSPILPGLAQQSVRSVVVCYSLSWTR